MQQQRQKTYAVGKSEGEGGSCLTDDDDDDDDLF